MGFLGSLLAGISGASSLMGLISGNSGVGRARQQQEQAIADYQRAGDADLNALLGSNSRNLYGQAGLGQDAVLSSARGLGDNLAAAGVYNSSAVGGATQLMQSDVASALARMAAEQNTNAARLRAQQNQQVAGMKLNLANQNYGEASQNRSNAQNSMYSMLGSFTQNSLADTGAKRSTALSSPLVNGNLNQVDAKLGLNRQKFPRKPGRLGMRIAQPSTTLGM